MQAALEALNTLKSGNARFVAAVRAQQTLSAPIELGNMSGAQKPIAVILGCSDSRVPAELVFNQGFGSLFVVRVAGNVAATSQLGSVEFAVTSFATPLIVVLGHSNCGAVAATIDAIGNPDRAVPENLRPIVDPIRPVVAPLVASSLSEDKSELLNQAVRANVRTVTERLKTESSVLKEQIEQQRLLVVGANYSLESGQVEFFDGVR